jgi:hypothetical protein
MATTRPNSDVSTSGWAASTGLSLYDMVDETIALDTDYITSPTIGTGNPIIMGLNSSLSAGTHYVTVRLKTTTANGYIRIMLLNNSNAIMGVSSWQAVTSSYNNYTIPVTISGTATRIQIATSMVDTALKVGSSIKTYPGTSGTASGIAGSGGQADSPACKIKGHWMLRTDSASRGLDGLWEINQFNALPNTQHIIGINVSIDWRSIEPTDGGYTWTRLDNMVNAIKSQGRKYTIEIFERSFWQFAAVQTVIPAFIPVEDGTGFGGSTFCMAKIWEQATMDQYIAVHKAVIDRYANDPLFCGFQGQELHPNVPSLENNNAQGMYTLMMPQWTRFYQEMAAYAPNLVFTACMGWVTWAEMEALANVMDAASPGMALSWPDTFIPNSMGGGAWGTGYLDSAEGTTYGWYRTARNRNASMIILPRVESTFIPNTLEAHDYIYTFLRDSIGATAIMWFHWYPGLSGQTYVTNTVLPTINSYGGVLTAPACTSIPPPPTPPPTPPGDIACKVKGNWIRFTDAASRGVDGTWEIQSRFLNVAGDKSNVVGLGLMIDWRSIEPTDGGYVWTRLDSMVNLARNNGYLWWVQIAERNFHQTCATSTTVPAFVPVETGDGSPNGVKCMARIWEQAVMDQYIAVHKAVIDRYSSDPYFVGFMGEEYAAAAPTLKSGNNWVTLMKPQWIRYSQQLAAYAPNLMYGNCMGWVEWAHQEELANIVDAGSPGGMLSWPDTFVPTELGGTGYYDAAEGTTWGWYNTARNRKTSMIIMPQAQTPFIPATLPSHDWIYTFLRDSIGATAIVWDSYHGSDANYVGNIILPTINNYGGVLTAPACSAIPTVIDTVINDMTLFHDGPSDVLEAIAGWGCGAYLPRTQNIARPSGWLYSIPWTHMMEDTSHANGNGYPWLVAGPYTGNSAANTRVQQRDVQMWWLLSNNTWVLGSHTAQPGNAMFPINWSEAGQINASESWRSETSNGGGASMLSIGRGTYESYQWHTWASPNLIPANAVGQLSVCFMRLILDNPNGTDDRSSARILGASGADWYKDAATISGEKIPGVNIQGAYNGRLKYITNDWQLFGASILTDAQLRIGYPPIIGV